MRQLQPITPRLKGPPIFVSKFVLTHVRVFAREGQLRVELWEQPKPAGQTLTLRAPRFDRAPAAAAAQRGQASPRGLRYLVACVLESVRVYMNSITLESIARDPEGRDG